MKILQLKNKICEIKNSLGRIIIYLTQQKRELIKQKMGPQKYIYTKEKERKNTKKNVRGL